MKGTVVEEKNGYTLEDLPGIGYQVRGYGMGHVQIIVQRSYEDYFAPNDYEIEFITEVIISGGMYIPRAASDISKEIARASEAAEHFEKVMNA